MTAEQEARPEMLRIFVAVEIPGNVRMILDEVQQRCRKALGAHPRAVRWVNVDGIHLTLAFLGETPRPQIPAIEQALHAAVQAVPSFELRVAGLGCFPSTQRPRVIWAGIGGDLPALNYLQAQVEQALQPLGYRPEHRSFSPHLTLGRVREDVDAETRRFTGAAIMELNSNPLPEFEQDTSLDVGHINLMQSILGPNGAKYTALMQFELKPHSD